MYNLHQSWIWVTQPQQKKQQIESCIKCTAGSNSDSEIHEWWESTFVNISVGFGESGASHRQTITNTVFFSQGESIINILLDVKLF